MGQEREIVLENDLVFNGEEYLLFCQYDTLSDIKKFIISIYSPQNIDMEIIPIETYPNILKNIYKSCARLSGKCENLDKGKILCMVIVVACYDIEHHATEHLSSFRIGQS